MPSHPLTELGAYLNSRSRLVGFGLRNAPLVIVHGHYTPQGPLAFASGPCAIRELRNGYPFVVGSFDFLPCRS